VDDVELPGEHRSWEGRTFGQAGMTTDVYSPCYPYKCVPGCPHDVIRVSADDVLTPEERSEWDRRAVHDVASRMMEKLNAYEDALFNEEFHR
jgi:hypothetical protein